jgi:hypothetical protein
MRVIHDQADALKKRLITRLFVAHLLLRFDKYYKNGDT